MLDRKALEAMPLVMLILAVVFFAVLLVIVLKLLKL